MASSIVYKCDMSGVEIGDNVVPVLLSVVNLKGNGEEFETQITLDLSDAEKGKLAKLLRPYFDKGSVAEKAPTKSSNGTNPETAKAREWALANGHKVSDRGRVPQTVIDAYRTSLNGASE